MVKDSTFPPDISFWVNICLACSILLSLVVFVVLQIISFFCTQACSFLVQFSKLLGRIFYYSILKTPQTHQALLHIQNDNLTSATFFLLIKRLLHILFNLILTKKKSMTSVIANWIFGTVFTQRWCTSRKKKGKYVFTEYIEQKIFVNNIDEKNNRMWNNRFEKRKKILLTCILREEDFPSAST